MKKIVAALLSCLLLCSFAGFPISANANIAEENRISQNDADYTELSEDLRLNVIGQLQSIQQTEGRDAIPNDYNIDWSRAFKVYTGTNLFNLESNRQQDIQAELDKSSYFWFLPVSYGGYAYTIKIVREQSTKPLAVVSVGLPQDGEDYIQLFNQKQQQLNQDWDAVRFVQGMPRLHYPVAVAFQDGTAAAILPFYDVQIEGTEQQKKSLSATDTQTATQAFSYEKYKEAANRMNPSSDEIGVAASIDFSKMNPEPQTITILLITGLVAVAVLAAVAIGVAVWMKKKRPQ